jgi:hypothetical protein
MWEIAEEKRLPPISMRRPWFGRGPGGHVAPEWYPIGGRVYLNMDAGPRLR